MSAAIASRRRPSRIASAIRGSSSTINTRTPSDADRPDISSAYRKTHTLRQHAAAFTEGVAYSQPARTAARWSRPNVYRVRRRRLVLGVVVALVLANTAGQLLNDTSHVRTPPVGPRNARGSDVSAVSWPQQGQAALVLGNGR